MANETILIVDADTKSQKVLEVSFKKAGYRVVMTDGPRRAEELVRDTSPDIIISDTAFPNGGDGFEFLAAVKAGPGKTVPFIFLTEERSLPQKMKGFELGADDYLTKPIYIKEVTTRVELLLQKRAKESLSDENIEELEGNLADITMIDLLQTIEEELRSGTIHLTLDMQSAVIYFREGNILDAICGKLQGEEAIYRLMLWPDGVFVLRYHDQVRRLDRIEKDSGALLLEGIRRLDKYNELVDKLPGLGRIFEADFERLTRMANALPDEVGRVVRLFDGLRSIREVCEGSPLDDVTTLKIVARLIEDDLISDVTPERGERAEMKTRSNLAAWLEGARSEAPVQTGYVREDTSPKFGSSITEMVEKRSTDRHLRPQHRKTLDNPFAAIDEAEADEEEIDPRRQTHIQWDVRGKSDWNIVLDEVDPNPSAAIREIEAEERRRRDEEARQLSDSGPRGAVSEQADDSHRESTLRFAPSVDRAQNPDLDKDLIRRIEEDEHRRRDEEARRLQEQLQNMQAQDGPLGATPRRSTDELPIQRRPAVSAPEEDEEQEAPPTLFGSDPRGSGEYQQPRERVNTPLSAPAFVRLEEPSSEPHVESPGLDVLSEADAFEDDSDELARSERATLDLRPPANLFEREETADVDPGELFTLASEETAPADDSMDDFDILLEPVATVERQARDRELVRAEFDLSRRRAVSPSDISGRMSSWERETVELPKSDGSAPATTKLEGAFFEAETPTAHDYYDEEERGGATQMAWIVGLLGIVAVGLAVLFLSGPSEPDEVAQKPTVAKPVQVEAPPEVPQIAEVDPLLVAPGLDADAASQRATEYGSNVGTGSQQLAVVMSGEVLGMLDEEPVAEEAVEPEELQPEEQLAVNTPAEVPAETTVEKDPEPEKVEEPPKNDEPVTASPAQVKQARSLIQRDRYDEALTLLRKLSESAPKDKEIAYLHGIAAFNSNHTGEAIESLSRAERLGKRTADLYLELAAAYQLDRKPQKAKWAYEKFLALQPNGRQADEVRSILSSQF